MKNLMTIMCIACLVCYTTNAMAVIGTFYVDSQNGDDNYEGTQAAPWRSLSKVNSTTFDPGSQIFLKRGGVWNGQLHPLGSGSSGSLNVIGAYGSGNAPLINGEGLVIAPVYLEDQEYWVIRDLELTNTDGTDQSQGKLFGIYVQQKISGIDYNHIHILNNDIHDVNGDVGGKDTGGIMVEVTSTGQTRIDNVLIEGNTVQNIGGVGIQNQTTQQNRTLTPGTNGSFYPWLYFKIRNNYINNTGRNGIIFRYSKDAIVEYNTVASNSRFDTGHGIFNFGTDDGIVQFMRLMEIPVQALIGEVLMQIIGLTGPKSNIIIAMTMNGFVGL